MVGEGDAFAAGRSAHHVLIRLVGLTEGRGNSNSNPFVLGLPSLLVSRLRLTLLFFFLVNDSFVTGFVGTMIGEYLYSRSIRIFQGWNETLFKPEARPFVERCSDDLSSLNLFAYRHLG